MQFAWRSTLQRLAFATSRSQVDPAFAMRLATASPSAGHSIAKARAYPSNGEAGSGRPRLSLAMRDHQGTAGGRDKHVPAQKNRQS